MKIRTFFVEYETFPAIPWNGKTFFTNKTKSLVDNLSKINVCKFQMEL